MTLHDVRVGAIWYERLRLNEKHADVRQDDRDYQAGDTIRFWRADEPEYRYSVERTITHVLRAVDGLDEGYVVLSLADPRVDDLRGRLDRAVENAQSLARSNAALRGRNRRLREAGR